MRLASIQAEWHVPLMSAPALSGPSGCVVQRITTFSSLAVPRKPVDPRQIVTHCTGVALCIRVTPSAELEAVARMALEHHLGFSAW